MGATDGADGTESVAGMARSYAMGRQHEMQERPMRATCHPPPCRLREGGARGGFPKAV